MKCLIVILGPTATGKTRLAIDLAKQFEGEIINADSRQVYRFVDIGTAKPNPSEQATVKHHLIDVVNPDESFSLAMYKELAGSKINDLQRKEFIPFLVGGSGLYIWSLVEGWTIPEVPPDNEFRTKSEAYAAKKGNEYLFEKLKILDPIAASTIQPTNLRRIIRALEIIEFTGQPASKLWQKKSPAFATKIIGLTTERKFLYSIIDARVDEMVKKGLVEEVNGLIDRGYDLSLPAMSGIGYRQIGMFLRGKSTLEESLQQIKYHTHQFVRRQYTWFRQNDERIHWFDINDTVQRKICDDIRLFLNNCKRGKNEN
jgi:tRNA dimethylallyltransferase